MKLRAVLFAVSRFAAVKFVGKFRFGERFLRARLFDDETYLLALPIFSVDVRVKIGDVGSACELRLELAFDFAVDFDPRPTLRSAGFDRNEEVPSIDGNFNDSIRDGVLFVA